MGYMQAAVCSYGGIVDTQARMSEAMVFVPTHPSSASAWLVFSRGTDLSHTHIPELPMLLHYNFTQL